MFQTHNNYSTIVHIQEETYDYKKEYTYIQHGTFLCALNICKEFVKVTDKRIKVLNIVFFESVVCDKQHYQAVLKIILLFPPRRKLLSKNLQKKKKKHIFFNGTESSRSTQKLLIYILELLFQKLFCKYHLST